MPRVNVDGDEALQEIIELCIFVARSNFAEIKYDLQNVTL